MLGYRILRMAVGFRTIVSISIRVDHGHKMRFKPYKDAWATAVGRFPHRSSICSYYNNKLRPVFCICSAMKRVLHSVADSQIARNKPAQ